MPQVARPRTTYTSGQEHLTTGRRISRGQAMRRSRFQFSSHFRSMPGSQPVGELSAVSEGGARRITGRSRGSLPSRMPAFTVDPRSIQAFYEYAQDFRDNAVQFKWAMDKILMMYAYIALAAAQKRSLGPVDPSMTMAAAAWKIPVRRITGEYFMGWEVQHMALGVWALTNTSREAFYIEFGINHSATGASGPNGQRLRIRRPVMKLAVLEAINIVRRTHADIDQLVGVVMPSGLYQSPMITGAIRKKGVTGSAMGLVNIEALQALAGGGS